jgi:hypothetical protein
MRGDHLSVDGSFIEANAGSSSRMAREQLPEAAEVKRTVRDKKNLSLKSQPGAYHLCRRDFLNATSFSILAEEQENIFGRFQEVRNRARQSE